MSAPVLDSSQRYMFSNKLFYLVVRSHILGFSSEGKVSVGVTPFGK